MDEHTDEIPTDDTQPGIGAVDDGDDDDGPDGDPLLLKKETPVRPRPKRRATRRSGRGGTN